MKKGGAGVVVAGILVAAACSGASRASSPPDTAPSTSTRSTSTTAISTTATSATITTTEPAFTFDGTVAPPPLVNTGTDYVAIVQSLERYGTWLGAHRPDPALAPTTVAPGTRLMSGYRDDLTYLRDHHLRIVEKLNGPDEVTILSATPDAFSARVVQHISVHQIFDRAGHLVNERRFVGATTYLEVVVRAHGRWYLASSDAQHPPVVHL